MIDIHQYPRWRASIHEDGHAAVITEFGFDTVLTAAIAARIERGKTSIAGGVRATPITTYDCPHKTYLADIAVLLGSIAAEKVFLGCRFDGAGGSHSGDANFWLSVRGRTPDRSASVPETKGASR